MLDREPQPHAQDLRVPRLRELEPTVQLGHCPRIQRRVRRLQEMQPLLRAPTGSPERVHGSSRDPASQFDVDGREQRRARIRRVGRHARVIEPAIDVEPARDLGQLLVEAAAELGGRHALERVLVEPTAEEHVEARAADHGFDRLQEQGAFRVRNLAEAVVGVMTFEIEVQHRLPRFQIGHVAFDAGARELHLHHGAFGAEDALHDPVLEIDGETLVEPEVAPRRVRHEVAGPRVRQLVRDQGHERLVPRDHRRCRESEARILHPAEREGRRQHEHVVAAPAVRTEQVLGRADHRFGVLELGVRALDHRRFGPDAAARRNWAEREVTARERDQVRRDRPVHPEAEGAFGVLAELLGAHQCRQAFRSTNPRRVRHADTGRILQRDPRPRQGCLALREEKRGLSTGSLARFEPLDGVGVRGGPVLDAHGCVRSGEVDRQGSAEPVVLGPQLELAGRAVGAQHALDREALRVQDERRARLPALEVEPNAAADRPRAEIELEVQVDVRDPHALGFGVTVGIHLRGLVRTSRGTGRHRTGQKDGKEASDRGALHRGPERPLPPRTKQGQRDLESPSHFGWEASSRSHRPPIFRPIAPRSPPCP